MSARDQARLDLLDLCAQIHQKHDPLGGWQHVGQLPRIEPEHIAICLDAQPDLMDDISVRPDCLADALRDGILGARQYVADSIFAQLRPVVQRYLLSKLQDYAEDQESAQASVEATRMNLTALQYAEHIRGVTP